MFDTGLDLSRWMLSGIDGDWGTVLEIPVLIVLLLIAVAVIVRLLPLADRVIGPVGSGLATLLGMLLLLPEYLCTVALRRSRRAPPGFFHTYGDGVVGLVFLGHRVSRAGLAGFTQGKGIRKLVILTVLGFVVAVGNAHSCPAPAAKCRPPLTAWWTTTKAVFDDKPAPPARPKPSKKPARKPVPRRTA